MIKPTDQQKIVIESQGNLAVIANPGSGKTFVLSEKIKLILPTLYEYKGVIAISYTNKASNELKSRSLSDGVNPKGSFFGTIDTFYISEIIIPFGKQVFGLPTDEFRVQRMSELDEFNDQMNELSNLIESDSWIEVVKNYFLQGRILLELVGRLANFIFDESRAAKNYLTSRYTHIIIDEYQDSGEEQHSLFKKLMKLGLVAIAVGDNNQSIFKFSGKSPEYLLELAKDQDNFQAIPLDFNHRCAPSIINYSLLLLNKNATLLKAEETVVFEKSVEGAERDIALWLNDAIPKLVTLLGVEKMNQVGVLVRNSRTAYLVSNNLPLPNKLFKSTSLEEDFNLWSRLFAQLLYLSQEEKPSIVAFLEAYQDVNRITIRQCYTAIRELLRLMSIDDRDVISLLDQFELIAMKLLPSSVSKKSLMLLREVLSDSTLVDSYKPALPSQIQIMTLHKSKGLEFEIVFHLDLYKYVLPKRRSDDFDRFDDIVQDLNLHYVGITRAKKACILCTSTKRTNWEYKIKTGSPSEFLLVEHLKKYRQLLNI
jgi:DNA helicase-2/ATP-dependent DNA helicase PcrA